jgi:hypothetical protein
MGSPVKLTKKQQADITRRYLISCRAAEWLRANGQPALAEHYGLAQSQVSKALTSGMKPKKLTSEQFDRLVTLAKRAKRVHKTLQDNSINALRNEYKISAERIRKIADGRGDEPKGKTGPKPKPKRATPEVSPVHRFLTMPLWETHGQTQTMAKKMATQRGLINGSH